MGELVRKELKSFFASLSGYVVLVFFLLANGLFLWIIPGGYHIPASGLADMQAFFTLAPLLYLFLVPALCMRLHPICRRKAYRYAGVTAYPPANYLADCRSKNLAGFLLVLFSILPTLVYPVSLWFLAQPVGHIDVGGIIGSYIGLIFLSGIYVAAGVWASALTENQIIAFLYTLVVAFLLYTGLDFIAGIPLFEDYQTSIQFWGIHFHYEPMSRGVIAFSDVVYFVSFVFLFLWATVGGFTEYG